MQSHDCPEDERIKLANVMIQRRSDKNHTEGKQILCFRTILINFFRFFISQFTAKLWKTMSQVIFSNSYTIVQTVIILFVIFKVWDLLQTNDELCDPLQDYLDCVRQTDHCEEIHSWRWTQVLDCKL